MSYIEELSTRVMFELTEILFYCHACEFQVLELLKVANCVFDKEEFFEIVDSYTNFKSNLEILENLMSQVDDPITMLQIITVKTMINELKENFDGLIGALDKADKRIDADKIDFDAAKLLNEIIGVVEFDVADFDAFEQALGVTQSGGYFVICMMNARDRDEVSRYGDLNVLMLETFRTKREAYTYALKNGISKNLVWSMYR